jgi:hypothetical protein
MVKRQSLFAFNTLFERFGILAETKRHLILITEITERGSLSEAVYAECACLRESFRNAGMGQNDEVRSKDVKKRVL